MSVSKWLSSIKDREVITRYSQEALGNLHRNSLNILRGIKFQEKDVGNFIVVDCKREEKGK